MKRNLLYLILLPLFFLSCKNNQANSETTTDTQTEQNTAETKDMTPLEKQMKHAVDSMEANRKPQVVITEGIDKLCDCYSKIGAFAATVVKDSIPTDNTKALALKQQYQDLAKLSSTCQSNLYSAKLLNKVTFIEAKKKCDTTFKNIRSVGIMVRRIK